MRPIQKIYVASMLFLLAIMVTTTVSAHYYFNYKYPSDPSTIARKLDSDFIKSRFGADEAKKAGYSDDEISSHLATAFKKERSDNMGNLVTAELSMFLVCFLVGLGVTIIRKDSTGGLIETASDGTAPKRLLDYVPALEMLRGDNKKKTLFWAVAAVCIIAGLIANPVETIKWTIIALVLQVVRMYGGKKIF
jgi:hypothetical protein